MSQGNRHAGHSNHSGQTAGRRKSVVPKTWFRILWFLLLASMAAIALVNIRPYVDAVQTIGGSVVDASLLRIISLIPVVNALAATLGVGVVWVVGTALWGVFQIIEVLPIVLYNHPEFLNEVIQEAESASKYAVRDNDDPTVANLKRVYNKLPVAFLENLSKIRLFAYATDFCICFWKYSPVASGKITDFFYYIMTGQFHRIIAGNLALALVTLFGVEIALNLLLWVGKLAWTYRKAQR